MKQSSFFSRFLLIAIFALPSLQLFAQNNTVVQLKGSKMRVPLEVHPGENNVVLSGLIAGNTYNVVAARAVTGQAVDLELKSANLSTNGASQVEVFAERKNILRFVADAENLSFSILANSSQSVSSIPMFLSVACETCVEPVVSAQKPLAEALANLQVQHNSSAESLIKNTLIGGDCFAISNVTSKGNPLSRGTFSNGSTNIDLGSGMVMSTGNINILPGPNLWPDGDGGFDVSGADVNLSNLVSGQLFDVNVIEFDFTPTANTVKFDFVFGSEEYCEWVGTDFLDVFGFFISGPGINGVQNLAVIPGTGGVPVTTNNVNHITNSVYYVNNNLNLFECLFSPANHLAECELDGWTKPLTAIASVVPCSTYHIKLAIADVVDGLWDSAVFLRANSFNAGGTVVASPAYQQPGLDKAYEGCANGSIRFERGNSDLSQPLTVNFSVSAASTATAGVDYAPLISPVTIPAGQSSLLLPVNVFSDGLVEGEESIRLLIDNSCQCRQAELHYLIDDNLPFNAFVFQDSTICEGRSVELYAGTDGGLEPYTFLWSTGDTSQHILVTPTMTTTYTVTITDACGETATDEAQVVVIPTLRDTAAVGICPGASVQIGGILYNQPGTVTDTLSGAFGCDSIVTYSISFLPQPSRSETITFCPGESVVVGGVTISSPGSLLLIIQAAVGCDTLVAYNFVLLPEPTRAQTIGFCPGESVTLGGNTYTQPATVVVKEPASVGCDTIVTYTLELLPEPTRVQTIGFCPGESVILGGNTYTQPGTLVVKEPASVGCDTIVTYTLELLPEPARAQTIGFCPGESVTLGGNTYTQPGTVVVKEPASIGCDTIVTYTLQYSTPAASNVSIVCPNAVSVAVGPNANSGVANYPDATASSDCVCPGMDITHSAGLASGSSFPLGVSQVCYMAKDACGQTKTCCFNVTVSEEDPCDIKTIGCMKYELLTITQDQAQKKTYRIRVTNNCPAPLIYTAIQLPFGLVATSPADNSTYNAPSGNQYKVRNPNFSPFYSTRYSTLGTGIANGQSDILRYTLPPQTDVTYIHIMAKLSVQQYIEAHLNTFYCPIGVTPPGDRIDESPVSLMPEWPAILVFPNPAADAINVDLSIWDGQRVQLQVFNSQGQRVLHLDKTAALEPQQLELPKGLANGLYFLEAATEAGEKEVVKFVVQH
jgi:Secretion system C-terminal sorting domain/HYR domain